MVGSAGPKYISPRSADVILSDIRPIKFNIEALGCLNALLDEILTGIITAAHSLTTERLKLGLLKVLPTTLGKEALLEAEVELRAYWDRTNASRPGSAQTAPENVADQDFNLQWAVELMRLKCEAYSTLNDSDEDPRAEARLNGRLPGGLSARKAALVAPAALYLTAVLESICEHILSNVGRVATRDSSTTTASLQDLFVALCEDDSMFSLFRTMKVYDQIEASTKMAKPRSSLSGHASPPVPEVPPAVPPSHRSRTPSDAGLPPVSGRPSFDKARAKLFKHGRTSSDREQNQPEAQSRKSSADGPKVNGHGQTDSLHSVASGDGEDTGSVKSVQFENRMRAGDTVKMSLTPDRLRTMDQEKNGRGGNKRQPAVKDSSERFPAASTQSSLQAPPAPPQNRPNPNRKTSFREIDSIYEYDDESKQQPNHDRSPAPAVRTRTNTGIHPSAPSNNGPPPVTRNRSLSTSNAANGNGGGIMRKSSMQHPMPPPPRSHRVPPPKLDDTAFGGPGSGGVPNRKRKIQRNLDDMDLDDIMNGSDEEDQEVNVPASAPTSRRPPATPKTGVKVSASTRELMDFLSEGPPPEMMSTPPPMAMNEDLTSSQSGKRTGRLQRMISKLSLANGKEGGEKSSMDGGPRSIHRMPSSSTISAPATPSMRSQYSFNNLAPMPVAVKPTPPRMMPPPETIAAPISPPASPLRGNDPRTQPQPGFESLRARSQSVSRQPSPVAAPSPFTPELKAKASEAEMVSMTDALRPRSSPSAAYGDREQSTPSPKVGRSAANGRPSSSRDTHRADGSPAPSPVTTKPSSSQGYSSRSRQPTRPGSDNNEKPVKLTRAASARRANAVAISLSPLGGGATPVMTQEMALDMRKMLANATNADECRLLVDMFLTRAGIKMPTTPVTATERGKDSPIPSTPTTVPTHSTTSSTESPVVTEASSSLHATPSATPSRTPTPVAPNSATPTPATPRSNAAPTNSNAPLEGSLVELFLGGSSEKYPSPPDSGDDGESSSTANGPASTPVTPMDEPYVPTKVAHARPRTNTNEGVFDLLEREKGAAARASIMVTPLA